MMRETGSRYDEIHEPPKRSEHELATLAAREEATFALGTAVRALNDASVRTTVGNERLHEIVSVIDELTDELLVNAVTEPLGMTWDSLGQRSSQANPVIGQRNPASVGLEMVWDIANEMVYAETTLGVRFEGPPTFVHGGISALILDQIVGAAPALIGMVAMTKTLTLTYHKPTPLLTPLRVESRIDRAEGRKIWATGQILLEDGTVTVEAEGLFIVPREIHQSPEGGG